MSVGAFSASIVAGVLTLEDGVQLVKLRGEKMMELYPQGYGLAAIVGLTEAQVSSLVNELFSEKRPIYVANINSSRQIVIAGSFAGIDHVSEAARKQGARKAARLNVPELSYCPLLEPVADVLRAILRQIRLQPPRMIYMSNVTGRGLRSQNEITNDLASNVAHSVRWYDATTVLAELGCDLFLEMPPGNVLSQLAQENTPSVRIASQDGSEPLQVCASSVVAVV